MKKLLLSVLIVLFLAVPAQAQVVTGVITGIVGGGISSANGFVASTPTEKYGTADGNSSSSLMYAQKFLVPTGTWNISRIGGWFKYVPGSGNTAFHLAIFTNDAVNGCPEVMVTNSDTGEIVVTNTSYEDKYFNYSTKPQVTSSGEYYWLVVIYYDADCAISRFTTAGTSVYKTGVYPTFATGSAWHTHTDSPADISLYAVYEAP